MPKEVKRASVYAERKELMLKILILTALMAGTNLNHGVITTAALPGNESDYRVISEVRKNHNIEVLKALSVWQKTNSCAPETHLTIALEKHNLTLTTEIFCK